MSVFNAIQKIHMGVPAVFPWRLIFYDTCHRISEIMIDIQ